MRIKLDYGKTGMDVEVPDRNLVGPLGAAAGPTAGRSGRQIGRVTRPPDRLGAALGAGSRSEVGLRLDLRHHAARAERISAAPILPTLERGGIPRENILILIATGLHRPNEGDELVELVGAEIAANYRVENHDGRNLSEHANLGVSPAASPCGSIAAMSRPISKSPPA